MPSRRGDRLLLLILCGGFLWGSPAQSQFLPFGRNKINYERFDWKVLSTPHFDIYHYPEMEELARIGAAYAEQGYTRLSREFDFTLLHRVPLILYSTPWYFQQTNVTPGFIPEGVGGFFEFIKGRVVIPANGSMEQFRHVIHHELVHVFMHTLIEKSFTERGIPGDRYPPLWFVEGLAECYSTRWDSQAEMLLRDAVNTGYFVPLSRILAINGTFLMYKEGQDMLEFMKREWGDDAPLRLLRTMWVSPDFNVVMNTALGVTIAEFDRAWIRDVKKRIWPLARDTELATDVSAPVAAQGFSGKPAIRMRGDSAEVIFVGNRSGYSGIYRSSLHGGNPELLLQGETSEALEAFRLLHSGMDVWKDSLLAFVTRSGEYDRLHLFSFTENAIVAAWSFPDLVMLQSPSVSPDGTRIAFSALDKGGRSDLYIFDRGTSTLLRLTQDIFDDRDPAWSPDGRVLVFASDRGEEGREGRSSLYAWSLNQSRIRRLTAGRGSVGAPAWSQDGSTLAFTDDGPGVPSLTVARWREDSLLRPRTVKALATGCFDPVWTPTGGLVFSCFEGGTFQIRHLEDVLPTLDSLPAWPAWGTIASHTGTWAPDTLAFPARQETPKYERMYQFDIAQSQISVDPVFGTLGGAVVSLSDMLGDDRYTFMLYNTAQTSSEFLTSFNLAISRISLSHRAPLAYGVFHYSGRRYDMLDPDRYFIERASGGYLALSYPLSSFRRIETSVSLTNSDKESLTESRQRKALLLTNSVSYIVDNAIFSSTGPLDGTRMNITLAYTSDVQYANVSYYSVMADIRTYLRLDTRTCLALRGDLLFNEGAEARRYFLGGSWDLRGWPLWSIRGTKRWLGSVELRFPLLDSFVLDLPIGSANLGLLRGALFADAGNCWDTRYHETRGSVGAGLRFSFLGFLVLRYDFGKRIEQNLSTLQDGLFHQFFFGWDF